MKTWPKITGFAAALAVVFGAAYGVGSLAGSDDADTKPGTRTSREVEVGEAGGADDAAEVPGGLQVSAHGYSIDLETPRIERGRSTEIRFAILDAQGRPVTDYEVEQEKELHLILASRDLTVYRHLHPTRSADGTWRMPVNLPTAGDYRLLADFAPAAEDGESLTLGTDLAVAGPYEPQELPQQVSTSEVDGYTVTLRGNLDTGSARDLTFEVREDGKPVTDLQPYLGAYGHLVALRAGDLAYLHVHPNSEAGDTSTKPGPTVSFTATAPSANAYRLFLDFKHDGEVRTASFTVQAGMGGDTAAEEDEHTEDSGSAEHGHG
ncbi:hypothetical protein ACFS5L_17600 [Streptomyces phyllanthi]|uniref:DUF748 domain-containing protein n=1 Tax=Streptomyces phyllanthi TaxID=1803180 RepID=A0A5N8VXD3_9ACTN|nr:hypothetical protein [Streptomyces phyllanthi]MPY38698.1 hypothetical protein [Streptomyces phyllanthi]